MSFGYHHDDDSEPGDFARGLMGGGGVRWAGSSTASMLVAERYRPDDPDEEAESAAGLAAPFPAPASPPPPPADESASSRALVVRPWALGATGHEVAINVHQRPGLTVVTSRPEVPACPICADAGLSEAMESVVEAGNYEECAAFLQETAPALNQRHILMEHMSHGIRDEDRREAHMVKSLLVQSYNIARDLGGEYATKAFFAGPDGAQHHLTVPNRHNIAGFAAATGVFMKLLVCKNALERRRRAPKCISSSGSGGR